MFGFTTLMALAWFLFAVTMKTPRFLTSYLLNVGRLDEAQERDMVEHLTRIRGVAEAVVIAGEEIAYLKVDSKTLDEEALAAFSMTAAPVEHL